MEGYEKVIERLENELNDAQREAELYLATKNEVLKLNEDLEARLQEAERHASLFRNVLEGMAFENLDDFEKKADMQDAFNLGAEAAKRMKAKLQEAEAERDRLEQLVDDFKDASLLNDSGGDPSGIEPKDVADHIHELRRTEADLEARNQHLVAALLWFRDQCCTWLDGRVPEARPGWMQPAIDKASTALSENAQPPTDDDGLGPVTEADLDGPAARLPTGLPQTFAFDWPTLERDALNPPDHAVGSLVRCVLELRQRLDVLTGSSTRDAFYDINKRLDALEHRHETHFHREGDSACGSYLFTGPPMSESDPPVKEDAMTGRFEMEGSTVYYDDTPEMHKRVFDYLIEHYFRKYGTFSGEVIMQSDDPQIHAPEILSEIADDVIGFSEVWK